MSINRPTKEKLILLTTHLRFLMIQSQSDYSIAMKLFLRFWDNCLLSILMSKLSFILSPIFLPNSPGNLKNQNMVSIVARTGRQFQRYNQGCRQVVGWVSSFSFSFFLFLFAFWGNFFFRSVRSFLAIFFIDWTLSEYFYV